MTDEVYKYLFDILDSIEILQAHVLNINSLFAYQNDLKTIDAVERRLSIIGEALNKANKLYPQLKVSNKIKIIGLRHLLIHNYDSSDDAAIWIYPKASSCFTNEVELLLKGYNGSTIN